MADRIILTIGTKKGVFVADAAKPRRSFALRGPFGPGIPVYATLIDTRGTPRLYASSCNPFFGMKVLRSTDMGKSFSETKSAPAFPKDDGRALANIWSLEAGGDKKDLWCGVEPASLFRSRDGGDSWDMVPGISNHDHARKWQPGNGGLCMHTIIRDGNRVHLGISTGGHYLSEDGGCRTTADGLIGRGLAGPGRTLAYYAVTTMATRGGRSLRDCRRTSDFLSWSTRMAPIRCTSCHLRGRRAPVLAPRQQCGAAKMAASHGAGSRVGCRGSKATSPSCATRWTSIGSSHPHFTLARRPVSCGSGGMVVSSGTACSIRCRRSTTSRSRSCDASEDFL